MTSACSIAAAANNRDGSTVTALLDGQPIGVLTFYAARQNLQSAAQQVAYAGGGPYILTLPHPGIWFLWSADDNGFCAQAAACLVNVSNDVYMNDAVQYLANFLRANVLGIQAVLQTWYPGLTMGDKQIVSGTAVNIVATPAILIYRPRWVENWVAMPFTKQHSITVELMCIVTHMDEEDETPMVVRLLQVVRDLLNQPALTTIQLPGMRINNAQITQGNSDVQELGDGKWASIGSLMWSALATITDVNF